MVWRIFLRETSGAVGVVAALTMPIVIGFAALGTDYGYFLYDRQRMQNTVDLAALSAAAAAGREDETARRIVIDNGDPSADVEVLLGGLVEAADGRTIFQEGASGGAVHVRAKRPTSLFLSALYLSEAPLLHVAATAVVRPAVSFAIGSKLTAVSGGIPAALTQSLLGSRVDLSILGYDGLVRSTLQASDLVAALADAVGATSGTIGELLEREITVKVLVQAVGGALRSAGKPAPAADVAHLGYNLASANARVRLSDVLDLPKDVRDLKIGTPSSYLSADVSVSGLLSAALTPRRSGSALSTNLTIPGLASASVALLVGEPMVQHPSVSVTNAGVSLETSQVRSRVRVETGVVLGLLSTKLEVPLEMAVAAGTASVTKAVCHADPLKRSVTVVVQPGAVRLELGESASKLESVGLTPNNRMADLLRLPLLTVRAHALATVRAANPTTLTFTGREIGNGTIRQIGSTRMVSALVDDLFRSLRLEVRVLGLGLGLGDSLVTSIVRTALLALSGPLDTILDGLLEALGVKIGAIDVRVDDVVCDQPKIAS
ncbi:pilus assembly protein TadG-related protein [Aureimonas phyllosphaerae]|uniref:pilus assembly protein TadG-related protein n=1 Tax=Aureimonas phyllosphaerae TaxID=1166078 RepID=UPI003A5C7641